jgi:hypothetical protein
LDAPFDRLRSDADSDIAAGGWYMAQSGDGLTAFAGTSRPRRQTADLDARYAAGTSRERVVLSDPTRAGDRDRDPRADPEPPAAENPSQVDRSG